MWSGGLQRLLLAAIIDCAVGSVGICRQVLPENPEDLVQWFANRLGVGDQLESGLRPVLAGDGAQRHASDVTCITASCQAI